MTLRHIIPALAASFLLATTPATARQDAPGEAGAAAPLQAEVTDVVGLVKSSAAPRDATSWADVKVGDKLGANVWVRTGLGSRCVLRIADRGEYSVKSATKIGIGALVVKDETVEAEIGLKYGAVHADVDHTKGETDMRVRTAAAVVALRGSDTHVGNSEMGVGFQQGTGHGQLSYNDGLSRMIGPGGKQTDGKKTPSQLQQNRLAVGLGDVLGGQTSAEQQIINDYLTGGNFDAITGGGFGVVPQNTTTPSCILSSYTTAPQTSWLRWSGSGSFTDPDWTHDTGSGGFGTWIGSGIFAFSDGTTGTWTGAGTWAGRLGEPVGVPEDYTASGKWKTDAGGGTFASSGRIVRSQTSIHGQPPGTWQAQGEAHQWHLVQTKR
ncbi:MAG: hypothetical protein GVY16_04310 [Planctomycetes bacterium]|jgi:hypothetical protein|nr:FecR domain-containing protein [Phycisphaerae bacterium]NBB94944.1 hypothetical protein [Planctomycetota bacterium]